MTENASILRGRMVTLKPITYDDCEDFIGWRNSAFIKKHFIYRKDITLEEQRDWIKNKVETGLVVQFIIWDNKDNKKIGCVYLQNIDTIKKEAEYGILIGEEEYVGGGRGTESANLLVTYAFEYLGLEKIYLRVLKDNIRAQKSYMKSGFSIEDYKETINIDDEQVDVVFMSISKELNK